MNIILGASGQVGAMIVENLVKKGKPVTAVIRDQKKKEKLKEVGVEIVVADNLDVNSLISAFGKGETVFLLTPESGEDENVLGKTETILENYFSALKASSVKRIVGLSSIGAQHASGTGNLVMSYMLEHAFSDLDVSQTFVRPAYYLSNWLPYADSAKETGILPTFFPVDFSISMVAPRDVADLLTEIIAEEEEGNFLYELYGADEYTPADVAETFSNIFGRQVTAQQIPRNDWRKTLENLKFSEDGVRNFVEMTQAVIDGRTKAAGNGVITKVGKTALSKYFYREIIGK